MKHKLAIIIMLLIVASAKAQSSESLLIGPGDLVHVQVFDTPELEEHARVTDAGTLPLIMGGNVKVVGLTPAGAAQEIETTLKSKHLMVNPRVLITVEEYATEKVTVMGEVHVPGAYQIDTPRSVLDVLTRAGGLTELADRKIIIERNGTSEKISYFVSNQADVAMDTAVKIDPGDTIIVPRAGLAFALGDVKNPGGYTMTDNEGQLSVLELVARAGGIAHTGAASHARLLRKTEQGYVEMALPLSDMEKGKKPDFALQQNDIIYVPFSFARNIAINATSIVASTGDAAIYHF